MNRYVSALLSHMEIYKSSLDEYTVDSVFIGGGTPTSLPEADLCRLVKGIRKIFPLAKGAEFTVEANPATVSQSLLKQLHRLGVNRISIGLQSANNRELKALSRAHTRQDFLESYKMVREAKFDNVNVDIMFGIPYQTFDSLMKTLSFAVRLGVEHISLYNLKIEPGTPFYENRDKVKELSADEDVEYAMYTSAIEYLARHGYEQYEISNFAKRDFRCYHNEKYWNCDEYLGFGVSAHSYFNGNRYSFIPDIKKYIVGIEDMGSSVDIIAENDSLELRERMGEYVMLRLRLTDGLKCEDFRRNFGSSFESLYGAKLKKYIDNGFMAKKGDSYCLTPQGMFVSNYILSDILEFEDLGAFMPNF